MSAAKVSSAAGSPQDTRRAGRGWGGFWARRPAPSSPRRPRWPWACGSTSSPGPACCSASPGTTTGCIRQRAAAGPGGGAVPRLRVRAAAGDHAAADPDRAAGQVTGTACGIAVARILTVLASTAVGVVLAGLLVRHRGLWRGRPWPAGCPRSIPPRRGPPARSSSNRGSRCSAWPARSRCCTATGWRWPAAGLGRRDVRVRGRDRVVGDHPGAGHRRPRAVQAEDGGALPGGVAAGFLARRAVRRSCHRRVLPERRHRPARSGYRPARVRSRPGCSR